MKLTFVEEHFSTEVPAGTQLLAAMRSAGIFVDAPCGGQGTCGKCLVFVCRKGENTWTAVQACQETVSEDLLVAVKEKPASHQILTTARRRQVPFRPLPFPAGPAAAACPNTRPGITSASSEDMRNESVLCSSENTRNAGVPCSSENTRNASAPARPGDTPGTPAAPSSPLCMAAVDIGTTTLAAYLLDRRDGREICTASCLNPQAAYGADVISRADYVLNHGPQELMDCIRQAVDDLIGTLTQKAGVPREAVVQVCLAGNTCMHHLFFGLPVDSLVRAPYVPYQKGLVRKPAAQYGLCIHPEGELLFLPVIAGFVGADTVGCLLAVRPDLSPEITLLIDIGTNGELVLGNRSHLVCCSTAAGPAFEGAKIECGMRGADGAIDHVAFQNGAFSFSVVSGIRPSGICGSGLIDAVACLRRAGLIDESGHLLSREELPAQHKEALAPHIAQKGNQTVFLFDPQQPEVCLTQKDIREVQLAKAAIAAGILLLERRLGITHAQVSRVCIAGAFGNYMNPDSACLIGLLPSALRNRILSVGNAAGEGAEIALQNRDELQTAAALSEQVEFVELAGIPDFQDCFVDELEFPEL